MHGLLEAYEERRRRELWDIAVAHNDPEQLEARYPDRAGVIENSAEVITERWWSTDG